MTGSDNDRMRYDRFLDELVEHTAASKSLRSAGVRHLEKDDDSASAVVEGVLLKQVEQIALRRYAEVATMVADAVG